MIPSTRDKTLRINSGTGRVPSKSRLQTGRLRSQALPAKLSSIIDQEYSVERLTGLPTEISLRYYSTFVHRCCISLGPANRSRTAARAADSNSKSKTTYNDKSKTPCREPRDVCCAKAGRIKASLTMVPDQLHRDSTLNPGMAPCSKSPLGIVKIGVSPSLTSTSFLAKPYLELIKPSRPTRFNTTPSAA